MKMVLPVVARAVERRLRRLNLLLACLRLRQR